MPERWERELDGLRHIEMRDSAIRERIERGPTVDREPSRRNALLAGIVAGAVVIAGIGALWQLDRDLARIGGDAADLPVLFVTFERSGLVLDEPDQQIPRVDTTIVYGDAREESFTSTTPPGALVDYVSVEEVTRLQPGPTVGSAIEFSADGQDPRVLIGQPSDWPQFERFTPIERLPEEPGDYVLVFEATYAEGTARTARLVRIVEPGAVQLVASEGDRLGGATAAAYLDGRRTNGFLSSSWFMAGDVGGTSPPLAATFEEGSSLHIPSGTPLLLGSEATEAHAGLVESYDDFELNESLPMDLSSADGSLEGQPGRYLLAVDVSWREGRTGWGEDGTEERAVFFFSVEIVSEQDPLPPPAETSSPEPGANDVVAIDIRRSSEETGDPEATARFGDQDVWMCPDGWTVVNPDGTEESVIFDCGQPRVFRAPVGTPIEVTGDFATLDVSAGVIGNRNPGTGRSVPALDPGTIVTLEYEVTWDDGSEATFRLLLTVSPDGSASTDSDVAATDAAPALRVRCHADEPAEVLTPVVSTQVDGLHVVPVDAPANWEIFLFPASDERQAWAAGSEDTDDEFARPVPPGQVGVACFDHETYTDVDLERLEGEASPFLLTDPDGLFTAFAPECDVSDQAQYHWRLDGVDNDDAGDLLRTLPGVRQDDVIQLAGYDWEWGSERVWRIVRDGHIVAGLSVDDGGGADGFVCRSSGITGDEG